MNALTTTDQLDRFLFDELPIRGERVVLQDLWQEILTRRDYPPMVKKLLGELIATTALLSATIKIEGTLTVQLEALGALNLLVVQVNDAGGIRAVARHKNCTGLNTLAELCGEGRIIITIDSPKFKEPYQGVIPLVDHTIAAAIERYFATSEQLATRIFLETDDNALAGILLQRLPGELIDEDAFNRIALLAASLTPEEHFMLDTKTLLYRLYSTDDIRLFEPSTLNFSCSCSKARSLGMVATLDKAELKTILAEDQGVVEITCEFCGAQYVFSEAELVEQLSS